MQGKLHSELVKQLDNATGPVQAVVQFRHADRAHLFPAAEDVPPLIDEVLERVEKLSGHSPKRINVLKNVASAAIEADPDFLKVLIAQPEVVAAMPGEISESMFIPPHGKRPA